VHAAAHLRIAGLVLVSPFTSIKRAVQSIAGSLIELFVKERFDNLSKIRNVRCPMLLIHGSEDRMIPLSHSEELHSSCE